MFYFIAAGQKLIIDMWKENSASPLHLLHAGFGVGSFIIPLVANPFLAIVADDTGNTTSANGTTAPSTTTESGHEVYLRQSKIEYAYAIAAGIVVCVSVVFYIYQFAGHEAQTDNGKMTDADGDNKSLSFRDMINPATCAGGRCLYGFQIFAAVFLFFFQAVGGERVAGKFIRAFSIDYMHFSSDDGSYLNTVFWIAFTCGRVGGFVAAHFVPIRILVMIETGGCLAGSIALMFLGTRGPLALWIIMPCLAVFIAPLFPSGIGWANYHINVTGLAITVFLLGGSFGGVSYMKLIGYLYDNYGPMTFIYTLLGYGGAAFVIAVLMNIIGSQHGSRFEWDKREASVPVTVDSKKQQVIEFDEVDEELRNKHNIKKVA